MPTPTPTPAFASEAEAFAAAEDVYRAYLEAFNAIDLEDPATFEPVFSFTTGEYERAERRDLSTMHAEGYIRGGAIETLSFEAELSAEGSLVSRVCNDISTTTLTDTNGASLVSPTRPDRIMLLLTFSDSSGELRISEAVTMLDSTC